jgi:hypothetical protein
VGHDETSISKVSTNVTSIDNLNSGVSGLTFNNHNEHFIFDKSSTEWSKSAISRNRRGQSLVDMSMVTENTNKQFLQRNVTEEEINHIDNTDMNEASEDDEYISFNSARDELSVRDANDEIDLFSDDELKLTESQNSKTSNSNSLPDIAPPSLGDQLSTERFLYLFQKNLQCAEKQKMEISHFTDLYYESLKLFKHFGSAVKLGFQEINSNANDILKNKVTLKNHLNLPDGAPEIRYME